MGRNSLKWDEVGRASGTRSVVIAPVISDTYRFKNNLVPVSPLFANGSRFKNTKNIFDPYIVGRASGTKKRDELANQKGETNENQTLDEAQDLQGM